MIASMMKAKLGPARKPSRRTLMKIEDHMSKNFSILPDRLSPSDAYARLGEEEFGVVVDDEGSPHALVTASDIRLLASLGAGALCESKERLPRTMVVEVEIDLSEAEKEQLKWLAETGGRGLVVRDIEKRVAGVVPFEPVLCSMMESSGGLFVVNSAATLGGDPNTGPPLLRCFSPGCGFSNRIHYLDDNRPPRCRNKALPSHPFKFQGEGGV
jgi:hypothetical protein